MKTRIKYLALGMALVFLLLGFSDSNAGFDSPFEERIFEIAAVELGFVPDAVQPGGIQRIELPLSNTNLYQVKLIDKETGEIYSTVIDEEGYFRNLENARRTELDARDALYGRLDPALHDRLETMTDSEWVTVGIWLRAEEPFPSDRAAIEPGPAAFETGDAEPPPPRLRSPRPPESLQEKIERNMEAALSERVLAIQDQQADQRAAADAARQDRAAELATEMAALQAPLLTDLDAQGFAVAYASTIAPLVYVELPKSTILALAQRVDIDTIYGPTESADLMNTAKPTQKADVVDLWGFDGTGIDVAILEDSRVEFNNPYLNAGTTRVPGDSNVDEHATATAGMVASQHATYQGIAQGVNLFSANATTYGDANLSAAMDWAAITQNVDIINNSWGDPAGTGLNQHDRHLDYIVRYLWSTVTVAAGNETDGCGTGTGKVTSPARGYNMISVGNYADQNTLTWDDDAMDACSSWVNPSTNIEKPEVAASGSSIISTTEVSPWIANVGSGTSYAAPMVAGAAALLMDRNSSLEARPEAVKAILMATAVNNIEGSSRLSSLDGAGGVDMRAAFHVVDQSWWGWNSRTSADFPYSYNFYAQAGEVVRAAIAWDSNPNSSYTTDPLQADIDLTVYQGSTYIAGSASIPNSYEVVEFTAPSTGSYEFRISAYSFSGTSEYVGFAFWMPHRPLVAYTPQTWSTPPVSGHYYRFNSGSYWNAVGIRSPSGADYDIDLYANSPFGDPDDYDWLEDSSLSTTVDFVVVDRNHAPAGYYYAEVVEYSGTGSYPIEWATWTADTADADGTYGPYTMTPGQVVRVWDSYLVAGIRKYFALKPISGNADLGMALYDSDPSTPSTCYKGRSQYLIMADSVVPGGNEFMNYQTSTTDWMGLVVWNNGATSTTSFNLYTDTTAPTGSIAINGGAAYASSTSVTLNLSGYDTQTGVAEMRFRNLGESWSAWQPYAVTKAWTLPIGVGTKTVYVQYRNNANMVSAEYGDSIFLDTSAPTGSIVINSGAAYTASTSVNLTLSASDTGSGVADMHIGNYGGSWDPWEPYVTGKAWSLIAGDGSKSVWVQYRDNAGNISGQYGDSIILDTTPPAGSIQINGGAAYTTSTSVTLNLSASDGTSGVNQMRFQNSGGSWSAWEAYATSKAWTLVAGDGTKTVYAQFRDNAGNVSAQYSDSIVLDTTKPTGSIQINGGAAKTPSLIVTLNLNASDATSGVTQMRFSNNGSVWSPWEGYSSIKTNWNLSSYGGSIAQGTKITYAQFRDAAGWISLSYSDTIVYQIVLPCAGDFDGDGSVDADDLAVFAAAFGSLSGEANYNPAADFDGSGSVDGIDLSVFVSEFGRIDCP
jgi:hypothetical protein